MCLSVCCNFFCKKTFKPVYTEGRSPQEVFKHSNTRQGLIRAPQALRYALKKKLRYYLGIFPKWQVLRWELWLHNAYWGAVSVEGCLQLVVFHLDDKIVIESPTIREHPSLSKIISDHPRPVEANRDHPRGVKSVWEYPTLSKSFPEECFRECKKVSERPDHTRLVLFLFSFSLFSFF